MPINNDWIKDTAEKYYKDGWFNKSNFRKTAFTIGDHDHCCIDFKKLSRLDYPESEKQGYYSSTDGTWFCTTCFEEYTKYRKLPIEKNTIEDIESALKNHQAVVVSLNNEQYYIKNISGKISVEHGEATIKYDSIADMENNHLFYGKLLSDIIEDIFVGYCEKI